MAFRPDDRVVYPGYGAGIIVSIEDKVFVGTTTRYYMLKMVADEGEFMVPVDQAESLRIRPVLDSDVILGILQAPPNELSEDYKERQATITRLLATSDAAQMSQAARDTAWFAGFRNLTGRDVQLYEELQTLLASELALAMDVSLEDARNRLAESLAAITERAQEEKAEQERAEQERAEQDEID
jgi:CarD family transcriptional regulator